MKRFVQQVHNTLGFAFSPHVFKLYTLDGVSERIIKGSILFATVLMSFLSIALLQLAIAGESAIWQVMNAPYIERGFEVAFTFTLFYSILHFLANVFWNAGGYLWYSLAVGLILVWLAVHFSGALLTAMFVIWLAFYVLLPTTDLVR